MLPQLNRMTMREGLARKGGIVLGQLRWERSESIKRVQICLFENYRLQEWWVSHMRLLLVSFLPENRFEKLPSIWLRTNRIIQGMVFVGKVVRFSLCRKQQKHTWYICLKMRKFSLSHHRRAILTSFQEPLCNPCETGYNNAKRYTARSSHSWPMAGLIMTYIPPSFSLPTTNVPRSTAVSHFPSHTPNSSDHFGSSYWQCIILFCWL